MLGNSSWLTDRMNDFAQILHASPASVEGKPVLVPGEIELAKMKQQQAQGISVDAELLNLLNRHAAAAP